MNIEFVEAIGSWRAVADAARTTVNKDPGTGEPSAKWKRKMLISEHSPIRQLIYRWKWTNLPSWVSVHLVRHKIGIEHFVSTQRTDRTGVDRSQLPQDAPVTHECIADAQAIINISRKRLCHKASPETRAAWEMFLVELSKVEPELVRVCVPDCMYRGLCPELKSCGFIGTEAWTKRYYKYYAGGLDE